MNGNDSKDFGELLSLLNEFLRVDPMAQASFLRLVDDISKELLPDNPFEAGVIGQDQGNN